MSGWRELTLGELADQGISIRVSAVSSAGVEVRGYRGELVIVATVFAAEVKRQGAALAIAEAIGKVALELMLANVVELKR